MKNFVLSLFVILVAGAVHASEHDPRTEREFARQFSGAENVKWFELEDGYQKAVFTLNGIRAEAYYDANAQFLGSARNLFFNQLPLSVMQTVNNKYSDATVISVMEIITTNGIHYNIVIEQKEKKYRLKLDSIGSVLEKERLKK